MKMLRNQFYRDTIPRYLEKLDTTETRFRHREQDGQPERGAGGRGHRRRKNRAYGAFDLYV